MIVAATFSVVWMFFRSHLNSCTLKCHKYHPSWLMQKQTNEMHQHPVWVRTGWSPAQRFTGKMRMTPCKIQGKIVTLMWDTRILNYCIALQIFLSFLFPLARAVLCAWAAQAVLVCPVVWGGWVLWFWVRPMMGSFFKESLSVLILHHKLEAVFFAYCWNILRRTYEGRKLGKQGLTNLTLIGISHGILPSSLFGNYRRNWERQVWLTQSRSLLCLT